MDERYGAEKKKTFHMRHVFSGLINKALRDETLINVLELAGFAGHYLRFKNQWSLLSCGNVDEPVFLPKSELSRKLTPALNRN